VLVCGGLEPADGRISWMPPAAGAQVPINSYLVCDGGHCVVVDCGVPAHESLVLAAVAELPGLERVTLAVTRGVEFDSMGNATALLRTLPVESVYAHPPSAAWFHFDPRFDVDDAAADQEQATAFELLRSGGAIPVGDGRDRSLAVLDPPLRLLPTNWLFDERTGTLFTSDAFGHVAAAGATRIVGAADDRVTPAEVQAGLMPKFGWLRDADVAPSCSALRDMFAELDVRVIAPTVGCVLVGREVVHRHVEMVLGVLERWGDGDGV
jgi:glyoxylase-like metal-dependent hydrolase (beta-lactamase superfamily II)